MPIKYSRLQAAVFSLYRKLIRSCKGRPGFKQYIQAEFRKNSKIPRTNIMRIEYLIRRGEKQLKDMQKEEIHSISMFQPKKGNEWENWCFHLSYNYDMTFFACEVSNFFVTHAIDVVNNNSHKYVHLFALQTVMCQIIHFCSFWIHQVYLYLYLLYLYIYK